MTKILVEKTVIEQALGALETSRGQWVHSVNAALCFKAIATLEETLAEQTEQEPVCIDWDTKTDEPIMGYAAPVRTKDLTDDEIVKVTGCEKDRPLWLTVSSIARAVIAADREKNK